MMNASRNNVSSKSAYKVLGAVIVAVASQSRCINLLGFNQRRSPYTELEVLVRLSHHR